MAFTSGRVSYCRLFVQGDAPRSVDETFLSILKEHRFQEMDIGVPDEPEVGWITPEHLFDTQFSYEKVGFGVPGEAVALLAMRVDTHNVPAEVKRAYRKINEQAVAAGNPSGFASKADKRDAADTAADQVREDLSSGKYRRSKMVPVMWDLGRGVLYLGATGGTATEQLARLVRQSFGVEVDVVTAGSLAGRLLRERGEGRDYEDLKPTPFTPPPSAARRAADDAEGAPVGDLSTPLCPWVATSIDLKDFLGNEFLIWLWWLTEAHEGLVRVHEPLTAELEAAVLIDASLDMDCAWGATGKQTLRGDGPTRLVEAGDALKTGKWPRKLGLILSDGEHQWELALHGDRMTIGSASLPDIDEAPGPRELVDARLELTRQLSDTLDALYTRFLTDRTGPGWSAQRERLATWVRDRK